MKFYLSALIIVPAILLAPFFSSAETNVTELVDGTLQDVIGGEIDSQLGLDKIKDIKNITPKDVGDRVVKDALGDIPSPTLGSILHQLGRSHTLTAGQTAQDGLFKRFTVKRPFGEGNLSAVNPICERIANQRMMEGIQNAEAKAHFAPWVEIAWDAVKSIADGGKTLSEMIAENTKSKVEELIKESLFGKAPVEIERVTIPHHDDCGTETVIVWDAQNGKLRIETSGDCGCKEYNSDGSSAHLNEFKVVLLADVTLKEVTIEEEENSFLWWKWTTHKINTFYKISNINVATVADCSKTCPMDTVGEPEDDPIPEPAGEDDDSGGGIISGIWGWFTGLFGGNDDPTGTTGTTGGTTTTGEEGSSTTGTTGVTPETDGSNNTSSGSAGSSSSTTGGSETATPQQCGASISIDGRSSVPTFPPEVTSGGTFACGGTCENHQLCVSVADQTLISGDCTYCQNVCEAGQFRHEFECNAAKGLNQECVVAGSRSGGKCYALKDTPPPTTTSGGCTVPADDLNQLFPPDVFTRTDLGGNKMKFSRSVCVHKSASSMQRAEDFNLSELRFSCPNTVLVDIEYSSSGSPCSATYQF